MINTQLELLKGELDKVLNPLINRLAQYTNTTQLIQIELNNFMDNFENELHSEKPDSDQISLPFAAFKRNLLESLTDEAEHLQQTDMATVKSEALKTSILANPYFIYEDAIPTANKLGSFQLKQDLPSYPPKTKIFLEQVTYLLNLYFTSYKIQERFQTLLDHPFLQFENLLKLRNNAGQFINKINSLEDKNSYPSLYQEINATKEEIESQLIDIHSITHSLASDAISSFPSIISLLKNIKVNIETYYNKFPNMHFFNVPVLTNMIADTNWHSILKRLTDHLFDKQYSYSTQQSTITISDEYSNNIERELLNLNPLVMNKTVVKYKVAIIQQAVSVIDGVRNQIMGDAAIEGIDLRVQPIHQEQILVATTSEPDHAPPKFSFRFLSFLGNDPKDWQPRQASQDCLQPLNAQEQQRNAETVNSLFEQTDEEWAASFCDSDHRTIPNAHG